MPFDTGYLDKSEETVGEYLQSVGYITALGGKWHLGSQHPLAFPTHHGFNTFFGFTGGCIDFYYHTYGKLGLDWYVDGKLSQEQGYSTDLITDYAIKFIENVRNSHYPFFLYLPYNAPHCGKSDPDSIPDNTLVVEEVKYEGYNMANTLQAPSEYISKFTHVSDPYRKVYSAMVASLDDNVGKLLEKLERDGILDNTMIWFISDNGGALHYGANNGDLRGQKGTLWEGGVRVPALMCWRKRIKSSQIIDTPVCNIDIVPTIGAITGFNADMSNSVIDGKDISRVLFNGEKLERHIFWKFNRQTAIRVGEWKLVNETQLYNVRNDRQERNDLALKYPKKVTELRKRFEEVNAIVK